MKITVIGCGRWGSFIAKYLSDIGHDVVLYGRESSKNMRELIETRSNALLTLPSEVRLSCDLADALAGAEVTVISQRVSFAQGSSIP